MRHGDKINNLGRTVQHRKALLRNLSIALIEHKRITTTLAKAKALRRFIEPIVTKAKNNTTHSRRVVFGYLQNKEAVKELYGPIASRVAERDGGYLRVIKLGFRKGDGAETAMIEFVDYNEVYNPNARKDKTAKKTRRGGKKASAVEAAAAETATAPVVEAEAPVVEQAPEAEVAHEQAVEAASIAEETVMSAEAAVEEQAPAAEATEEQAPEAPAAEEEKKEDA